MFYFLRQFAAIFVLQVALFGTNEGQTRAEKSNAEGARRLLIEASAALENGNLTEAKSILRRVLKTAPNDAAAHTLTGIIADRENDLTAAEKHFAFAARLEPKSPETRNNYGAILLRLGRKTEAAKEFTASLAANPNQASALVNLAQIRVSENDSQTARQLFEKAKIIEPNAELARAVLVLSLQLKDTAAAKLDFREYFKLAKDSANQAARTELGSLLLENGLFEESVQELEAALALDSTDANTLIALSRAYLRQKDVRAAGRLLESAIARGVDDGEVYVSLAEVYKAGGYFENAIPAMRRAIEKEPKNEFYRVRYGLLLIDSRAPAAAVIRLNESVAEFPNSARLWLALGIAQQIEGKMSEAHSSFEKSLQIEPKSVPALAYLANSLIEQARYAEAVKIYERALALDEQNAILHYLLADTLLKIPASDERKIQKHLERSAALDENFAQARLTLGKFYARTEKWEKAVVEFEQAARNAPDAAEIHYQLGRALARLKRTEESKRAFDAYKKLNETQTARKEIDRQDLIRRLANVHF
jgi:protein O-GlcNAc transferase